MIKALIAIFAIYLLYRCGQAADSVHTAATAPAPVAAPRYDSSPAPTKEGAQLGNQYREWREMAASADPKDREAVSRVRKMKWYDACAAWGRELRKSSDSRITIALSAFVTSERMANDKDWAHINDRTLEIGMTECGMFASRGMPENSNNTTTAYGRSTQYVYGGSRNYVYVEPSPLYAVGVIRAIQN